LYTSLRSDKRCMNKRICYVMLPSLTPYNLPFTKMGVPNAASGPTSRRVLSPGEYDRRYR